MSNNLSTPPKSQMKGDLFRPLFHLLTEAGRCPCLSLPGPSLQRLISTFISIKTTNSLGSKATSHNHENCKNSIGDPFIRVEHLYFV